jgi:hypothetical protein
VVERPSPRPYHRQHLCLDKGYDFPEIEAGVIARRYVPHMRHRGELEDPVKRYKPKRWVVERSASWLNRFRKLLIRWEKKAENYLGLVQLACSIMVYRRIILGSALRPSAALRSFGESKSSGTRLTWTIHVSRDTDTTPMPTAQSSKLL